VDESQKIQQKICFRMYSM